MRTSLFLLVGLLAACSAHREAGSAPVSAPPEHPFMMVLAPFEAATPAAEAEAKAERERTSNALSSLVPGQVVTLVQASGAPPTDASQAAALARTLGADGTLWGRVSLQDGKLTLQRQFHTAKGWDIAGTFLPTTHVLADPKQLQARDTEARDFAQLVLYGVNLAFMLDDQPAQSRRTLEALRPGRAPDDFATQNEGLVRRRWGMLGRLLRDGPATEERYRSSLAWLAEQRHLHPGESASGFDAQEALYTVGLARGLLLQGRPQDVVPLLIPLNERMPQDTETRQLLGRALLALGEDARAAAMLEPVTHQGYDAVSTRMYVAALRGQPGAEARTREAFTTLLAKRPDTPAFALLPFLASAGADPRSLKALAASQPADTWPVPVARFLTGKADEAALWASTKAPGREERERRCWVHYLLGEAELAGVMPGRSGSPDREAARRHFEAALATHAFGEDAYNLADFQLEQLRRTGR